MTLQITVDMKYAQFDTSLLDFLGLAASSKVLLPSSNRATVLYNHFVHTHEIRDWQIKNKYIKLPF